MKFCKYEKCVHYATKTKYPRKCFYEPQCWRGYLDILAAMLRIWLKQRTLETVEEHVSSPSQNGPVKGPRRNGTD